MYLETILFFLGMAFLIKGASLLIDGAISFSSNYKIPKIVVALTIVAFGTSAPELAISFKSVLSGNVDLVIGNIVGSNVINILLLLGIAACIRPLVIKKGTEKTEISFLILISVLLVALFFSNAVLGNMFSDLIARNFILLVVVLLTFVYYVFLLINAKVPKYKLEEANYSKAVSLVFIVLGLAGLIFGSGLVVDNALKIATFLGVSERIIALTLLAVGTSMPELVTTLVAIKKKEKEILVGNIIGSNIFNISLIGIPLAMFGTLSLESFFYLDFIALIMAPIILYWLVVRDGLVSRIEGIFMLTLFLGYYFFIIF